MTLHVGPGTFRPITAPTLAEHKLDAEWGTIGPEAVEQILACRQRGGRVVAVGTTSVRLLETAAAGGTLEPFSGETDLFIRPPCQFRVVDALLTNFHLPRTTLLVLVRTFGGDELIRRAYDEAIRAAVSFLQLRRRDVDPVRKVRGCRMNELHSEAGAGGSHGTVSPAGLFSRLLPRRGSLPGRAVQPAARSAIGRAPKWSRTRASSN